MTTKSAKTATNAEHATGPAPWAEPPGTGLPRKPLPRSSGRSGSSRVFLGHVLAGNVCLHAAGFQDCPWCGSTDPAHDPAPCARAEFRGDRRALEGW
ncbi:MAG: hypothetical protein KGJ23_11325 [Euryarchaeota archaeon]|nr:hypothetical protein [Euryarchaeota archaeon]MDE1837185.1 hypothetical protein [Euryarchaeota archaeon]MDE1881689.1 hypothetical protein [Euryarchaeota archaeon]MDE2045341.1 hypothetical protein [Thermoplasmata archaeon]